MKKLMLIFFLSLFVLLGCSKMQPDPIKPILTFEERHKVLVSESIKKTNRSPISPASSLDNDYTGGKVLRTVGLGSTL